MYLCKWDLICINHMNDISHMVIITVSVRRTVQLDKRASETKDKRLCEVYFIGPLFAQIGTPLFVLWYVCRI